MRAETNYARRLFPEQMTARRDARDEAALLAAQEAPQEAEALPALYYSAPSPYKDALEHAFWKAQFAASVREMAEPLHYTLHDHNLERVQENVRTFLAGVDSLLAPLTAQKLAEGHPAADPALMPPSQMEKTAKVEVDALLRISPYWLTALCDRGAAFLDRVFAAMDRRLPLWMGAVVIVAVPYFLYVFVRAYGVREGW